MERRFRVLNFALIATLGLAVWLPAQTVTIHGQVLREDTGVPLAGVEVLVARPGSPFLEAHLETNREGRFYMNGLPDGDYELRVHRAGFLDAVTALSSLDGPLTLRLTRGGVISGRVTWRDGEPMAALAHLLERAPEGRMRRTGYSAGTQVDGRYRIHGIRPGAYYLEIRPATTNIIGGGSLYPSVNSPELFEVAGGEEFPGRDLAMMMEHRVPVWGHVDIVDQPPSSRDGSGRGQTYSVAIGPRDQPGHVTAWSHADGLGEFRFPAIVPGRYILYGAGPSGFS
ncbi:MAG: carboxypeptidase regulatory-like domain-containing protein, partial [Bryobacterales bacterium]|nr:carboxypeptidase regulatory-like domain-containing protein [Bryobacterales bacterium]